MKTIVPYICCLVLMLAVFVQSGLLMESAHTSDRLLAQIKRANRAMDELSAADEELKAADEKLKAATEELRKACRK